ncbi:MAG: hypothetical protein JRE70_05840 [Deltaproteobacteria bacterium]|nr:hypothetical protein [Deltaproteobacteria bacterium]
MSKQHELTIIPLPEGGVISPEEALRWLREDSRPYLAVLYMGPEATKSDSVRGSLGMFGIDIATMVEACTAAIESQEAQRIVRAHELGHREWTSDAKCLADVITTSSWMEDGRGLSEWVFDALSEELARRLTDLEVVGLEVPHV